MNFWTGPAHVQKEWEGIPVHQIRFHLALPTPYSRLAPRLAYRALWRALMRIRINFPFDLILAWTGEYLGLAASWVAQKMGLPFISTAIGSDVNLAIARPRSLRYRVEQNLFLNSDLVLCVSRDLKTKVTAMTGGQAQALTFHPGLDVNAFCRDESSRRAYRAKLGFGDSTKVIVFSGNLKQAKGIYDLLEAFAVVARNDASLLLLLVEN